MKSHYPAVPPATAQPPYPALVTANRKQRQQQGVCRIHFGDGALHCYSYKSVDVERTHKPTNAAIYIYIILYRSSGTILLCFPLPVVGISSNDRPLCTSDIYHPVLIYTVRIDVKANTTISVRRPKSNDIPGGDLEKMIDGTYTDRVCCYNIMLYIYIYITTIVRAPDVGNQ